MMIYWQSIVPEHFTGVFTPIIRKADCKALPMAFCPGCSCCGSGESGIEMCALWKVCCLTRQSPAHSAHISLPDSPEPQQLQSGQNAIGSALQSALLMMGVKMSETCWGTIDCQ